MFTISKKLFYTSLICLFTSFNYAQWFALPTPIGPFSFTNPNNCYSTSLPDVIQPIANGKFIYSTYCYYSPSSGGKVYVHLSNYDLSNMSVIYQEQSGIGCCSLKSINYLNDSTFTYSIQHAGFASHKYTKNDHATVKNLANYPGIPASSCVTNKYIYEVLLSGLSTYVYDTLGVMKSFSHYSNYNPYINALQFVNDSTGYTLSTFTSNISKTTLLKTVDYAANWSPVLIDSVNAITDYHLLPNGNIYLCKKNGQIQKSIDAGATWSLISTATPTVNYSAIRFISDSIGYLGGSSGTLLKTLNYGVTWSNETISTTKKIEKLYNFGNVVYCVDSTKHVFKNQPLLVGIKKNNIYESKISIYPNPTDSKFIIELSDIVLKEKLHIFNFLGIEIITSDINGFTTEIDLHDQPSGIYTLKIGSFTKKIVKN